MSAETLAARLATVDPDVRRYRLVAAEATLRTRIRQRPETEGPHAWCLDHLQAGLMLMANAAFGALEEMRRVARPGGRVVISSNGPLAMRRLLDLHYQAALDAGYTPTEPRGSWFHLDHLEQVRDVFPRVERDVVESALEFSEPNPRCASTPQIVSTSSRMYRRMAATVRDCSSPDTQDGGGSA